MTWEVTSVAVVCKTKMFLCVTPLPAVRWCGTGRVMLSCRPSVCPSVRTYVNMISFSDGHSRTSVLREGRVSGPPVLTPL